jgi:hypothetical protein
MRKTYEIISVKATSLNFTLPTIPPTDYAKLSVMREARSFLAMMRRYKRSVTFSDNPDPEGNLPRMTKEVGVLADAHFSHETFCSITTAASSWR